MKQSTSRVTTSSGTTNAFHETNCAGLFEDYYITRKYWHIYIDYVFSACDMPNPGQTVAKGAEYSKYSLLALDVCSFDKVAFM